MINDANEKRMFNMTWKLFNSKIEFLENENDLSLRKLRRNIDEKKIMSAFEIKNILDKVFVELENKIENIYITMLDIESIISNMGKWEY